MQKTQPIVIVLLGPTASGKTKLAIEIAQKLNIEIHNIDSRQLYKGMNIGTATPTLKQQQQIKHLTNQHSRSRGVAKVSVGIPMQHGNVTKTCL